MPYKKILLVLGLLVCLAAFWQHVQKQPENSQNPPSPTTTPNIQVGLNQTENFSQKPSAKGENFVLPNYLKLHTYALEGFWRFSEDAALLDKSNGKIKLHFYGKKVILRAESKKPATIKIATDSLAPTFLEISSLQDYIVFESNSANEHTLEITVSNPEFQLTNMHFR
jgi:hypothetical protein